MQNSFRHLALIRLRQSGRMLQSVGWGLLLFAILLCIGPLLSLIVRLQTMSNIEIALLLAFPMLFTHFARKDAKFLQKIAYPKYITFCFEYHLAILPFALAFAFYLRQWQFLPISSLFLCLISLLPFNRLQASDRPLLSFSMFPVLAFEWRAGWRRYRWAFLLFYLPGLLLAQFTAGPLVSLVLCMFLFTAFYDELEPPILLEQLLLSNNFLFKKIGLHIGIYLVSMMPISVAFVLFHPAYWYLILIGLTFGILLLSFALFYKYASYRPHRYRVYNQNAIGVFAIGLFIPLFLPGSLLYLIIYHRRALSRLAWFYSPKSIT